MAVPPTYDVSLDDINALVIWDVRRSTDPTPGEIEGWIPIGAAEVSGRLGTLTGDCDSEAHRARAKHALALYVAAMAEDAHYPERAGKPGSYGTRLWDRWDKQLDRLAVDVEQCRDGTSEDTSGGSGHGFPDTPMFTQTQRF